MEPSHEQVLGLKGRNPKFDLNAGLGLAVGATGWLGAAGWLGDNSLLVYSSLRRGRSRR